MVSVTEKQSKNGHQELNNETNAVIRENQCYHGLGLWQCGERQVDEQWRCSGRQVNIPEVFGPKMRDKE